MNNFSNVNNTPDWQNLKVLHRNRLRPRAHFLPYASLEENAGNIPGEGGGGRCVLLNGAWLFRYVDNVQRLSEGFSPTDREGYDEIAVPSCWQYTGYEPPFYLNVPFQFPAIPPLVPNNNPVGIYHRVFAFDRPAFDREYSRVILTFQGVCSAFDVYLNGSYVGYSQGSHMPAEFYIQDFLRDGENDLCVLVYKWCDGSYLECQDMFRNNGIFRDVYFTLLKDSFVFDVAFQTQKTEGGYLAKLNVCVVNPGSNSLEYSLSGQKEEVCRGVIPAGEGGGTEFFVQNPREWSAETPELYRLSLSLINSRGCLENVCLEVGFREIAIRDGVFTLNGAPIKCKGVNHHDTHPQNGWTMTDEQMLRDVLLMKEYNIDTVRFSHYPPSPQMLIYCNRYGLYVVDEADIESHGALYMDEGGSYFSEHEEWREAFLDRVERMYQRDKNNPCIIMWSLGNESGMVKNHAVCYDYLKALDSRTPVHYEGVYALENAYGLDVISFMYPSVEMLRQMSGEKNTGRPFFMCEYCHSMGVGPGGLSDYWEEIYGNPRAMGGCVWEWCEHTANYPFRDAYGGDNGEYIHNGNFCVDGMMSPERLPTPSAAYVKNAYRPVVSKLGGEGLLLYNTRSFRDTSDLTFEVSFRVGGEERYKRLETPIIPPLGRYFLSLANLPREEERDSTVVVRTLEAATGREVGVCQHELAGASFRYAPGKAHPVAAIRRPGGIRFSVGEHEIEFSRATCTVESYRFRGKELWNTTPFNGGYNGFSRPLAGFLPNIYRRRIDNDMYIDKLWREHYYHMEWTHVLSYQLAEQKDSFRIEVETLLSPPKVSGQFKNSVVYTILPDGGVKVSCRLTPQKPGLPYLPRYGLRLELAEDFDYAEWYGLGPGENYCDAKEGMVLGKYACSVKELYYPYIRPQEGGNRGGVRSLSLVSRARGLRFDVYADGGPLNFTARKFVSEDFERAAHHWELPQRPTTELSIDGCFSGVGSNSCGPELPDQYRVDPYSLPEFSFVFRAGEEMPSRKAECLQTLEPENPTKPG